MSQILGIKFSDHGPVCYFASGANVVRAGQSVLVETDQGLALGMWRRRRSGDRRRTLTWSWPRPSRRQRSGPFEAVLVGADWHDDAPLAEAARSPAEVEGRRRRVSEHPHETAPQRQLLGRLQYQPSLSAAGLRDLPLAQSKI
jgi:hypothetical protein